MSSRNGLTARHIPDFKLSTGRIFFASSLYAIGTALLMWNEMKAVEVNRLITSVIEDLHKITDITSVNKKHDNCIVYIYGYLEVEEPLTEPEYGLSVPAVILKRRVQMYQWAEKKEEAFIESNIVSPLDFYRYETEWRDKTIDSSNFYLQDGHHNPKEFPVISHLYISSSVKVGAFTLSTELKNKFKDFTLITSDERPERHDIKMHAGLYYHTLDVWNPKVGDVRLQFSYAGNMGDAVSIIATQRGKTLGGDHLLLLEKGKIPPDQMITNEHNWNMWLVRMYRICGWFCLYTACSLLKTVFYNLAVRYKKVYLFLTLDRRISPYTSVASLIMALIVCTLWFFYKPWIGTVIFLTFISPFICCVTFREVKDVNNDYKKI